jgi:hypothetical protein
MSGSRTTLGAVASSKYGADVLRPIVAASHSMAEVIRKLGLVTSGGNHRHISACVRRAGLDTSHFGSSHQLTFTSMGREHMEVLVRTCQSVAQVLTKLGLPNNGRPHYDLKRYLASRNFDTSHFRGCGWSRGDTKHTNASVARVAMKNSSPDAEVFRENGPSLSGRLATQRLLAMGWQYECALCGLGNQWCERPLVLHVDHINGINNDNRLINLRFLCPNCHSQTPTYCRRARESSLLGLAAACYTRRLASVLEW